MSVGHIFTGSCYLSSNFDTTTYLHDGLGEIILHFLVSIFSPVKQEYFNVQLLGELKDVEDVTCAQQEEQCFVYCRSN